MKKYIKRLLGIDEILKNIEEILKINQKRKRN